MVFRSVVLQRPIGLAAFVCVALGATALLPVQAASAATGDQLRQVTVTNSGNGRGMAFDGQHLFYTLEGDSSIYETDTQGNAIQTIQSPATGGPLAWDGTALWTMDYSANSDILYRVGIDGAVLSQCSLSAANPGDPGIAGVEYYPDGLDYSNGSIWISNEIDSPSLWIVQVDTSCKVQSEFQPPVDSSGYGPSGIAVAGNSLWAAYPETSQVQQMTLSGSFTGVSFSTSSLQLEDLAFDSKTFSPTCALWGNNATDSGNVLTAYEVPCETTDTYVALGDSYSSGEGDGNYLQGTDTPTDHCHRSTSAYPELLDQSQGLGSLDFVSCSGAITDDYFNANNEGNNEAAQSQALSSNTQYVTVTFGGNDLGFSDVLAKCIYGKVGPVVVQAANCATDTSLKATVAKRLQALAGTATAKTPAGVPIHSIASVLQGVHQLAPNAKIYVAVYPLLFGTNFTSDCGVGTVLATHVPIIGTVKVALKLNKAEITWLNSVGTSLANVTKTAAAANDATFVNVNPTFKSHRFCDTSKSWFNYVSGTYNDKTKQKNIWVGSFHPTPTGQKSGYEVAFRTAGL